MSNREKTAGETANVSAAGAEKITGTGYIARINEHIYGGYLLATTCKGTTIEHINLDGKHKIMKDMSLCLFPSPIHAWNAALDPVNAHCLGKDFPQILEVRIEATVVGTEKVEVRHAKVEGVA